MLDQLSPLTMIQVDLIQMDDYAADSCAISPMTFLFLNESWAENNSIM